MINLNKKYVFALLLILLILTSGCLGGKSKSGGTTKVKKDIKKSVEDVRKGTEGILVSFVPNNPPAKMSVEKDAPNDIKVVLQLNNKGAYPQPDEGAKGLGPGFGRVYLSGYDKNIIEFTQKSFDLSHTALEGKSTINPNGGIDFVTFDGKVKVENLNVEKYEPTLLATACYYYFTIAGPQVCIDPDPYSTITQKKVCEVSDTTLNNQGAPIAITKIEEEALATKTQFRITIKNVGGGEVLKGSVSDPSGLSLGLGPEAFDKCNPFGTKKLEREDVDKVNVLEVKIGNKDLLCGPFAEGTVKNTNGFVRLINNEGAIICELPKQYYGEANTAYTTPLKIKLSYVYKNTAERKVLIKRETGAVIGESSSSSTNIPADGAGYGV